MTLLRDRTSTFKSSCFVLLLGCLSIGSCPKLHALCGLEDAAMEVVRFVDDPEVGEILHQKLAEVRCAVCHIAGFGGPRNAFGSALNTLLTAQDREDSFRQREAGRRMLDILLDPSAPGSPSFGELLLSGRLPVHSYLPVGDPPPVVPPRESENVTVAEVLRRSKQTQAKSGGGILQFSRCVEMSPQVAQACAEFRGEMLILGLNKLTPEVAGALAGSQAGTVWLHSVTSVSPEVAVSLAKMRAKLVLSGLAKLDSVPLAEKLVSRPGALSFPHLKTISPEIATVLARNGKSLTLAGLTSVPFEVQEKLAQTVGALHLPNLKSIDFLPLAIKLASGSVVLPGLEKLSAEHAKLFPNAEGVASFYGGIVLPLAAVTPEVAAAFAPEPNRANGSLVNLILVGGGSISDAAFRALLQSRARLVLQNVESLSPGQKRVLSELHAERKSQPGLPPLAPLFLPGAKDLDTPILAEGLALGKRGLYFAPSNRGILSISDEVAAALGDLPDTVRKSADGTEVLEPNGNLAFPSLKHLAPATARLLLKRRWLEISLPSLDEVSPEIIRGLALQTFQLTLGITALPKESADAFAQISRDPSMGGGFIALPNLRNLSAQAARILVHSLNRGVEDLGYARTSKSPNLHLGGDGISSGSRFKTLAPDVAVELAKYNGFLCITGLEDLPDESAAGLSTFAGTYLVLFGPAVERLSQAAAASLAKTTGVLQLSLRELDSVPLAKRFARQTNWALYDLETISNEAAIALSEYKHFIYLRKLRILESPELARRFVADKSSGGITLPALHILSAEAAGILAASTKPLHLGLTVLDSPEVAAALANTQGSVELPRLRVATPEVMKILAASGNIKLPEDPPYLLPTKSNSAGK